MLDALTPLAALALKSKHLPFELIHAQRLPDDFRFSMHSALLGSQTGLPLPFHRFNHSNYAFLEDRIIVCKEDQCLVSELWPMRDCLLRVIFDLQCFGRRKFLKDRKIICRRGGCYEMHLGMSGALLLFQFQLSQRAHDVGHLQIPHWASGPAFSRPLQNSQVGQFLLAWPFGW